MSGCVCGFSYMTCIELDERDGQMEHVCVSAPPHGVECRVSRGSLRLALVFFPADSRQPRAAAGGPGPDRDRGPGRVRRSRWIQDLLTDPRPRFNMAATQRSRTGAPPNPPSACLWPGMRPHLASVFKGSSKTRVNIGRPLIRGGTSSATGAVTGALLYSSRRSSRASAIAAHRGEPTGKRGNHLFA